MKEFRVFLAICVVLFLNGIAILNVAGQENNTTNPAADKTPPPGTDRSGSSAGDQAEPDLAARQKEIDELLEKQVIHHGRSDERYRIGFQDTLDVQVFRHPELSQTVSVNPDGTIRLFRINNPIVAVCKTERELAGIVETLYKNYLRTPQVNVRSVQQRSQPFAVIGAVKKPGSFYLNEKVRLIQLLALAEGPDLETAGMQIRVARIGNLAGCLDNPDAFDENTEVEFLTYNLLDVLKGQQNPWMEPGDVVSVLEAEEAYVVGDVIEPTKIQLKTPKTLTEAIAEAGGFEKNAQRDKVVIQRREPGSPVKTELVFSLKDIRANKAEDPFLQANDIVIVSTDMGKAITSSVLKAFTGGLGNLLYGIPRP